MLKYVPKYVQGGVVMEEKNSKLYLELQMDELRESLGVEVPLKSANSAQNEKNAQLAKLYEDAAEYEAQLLSFERELEVINNVAIEDMVSQLTLQLPDENRDFAQELKAIVLAGWSQFSDVDSAHIDTQLALINASHFHEIPQRMHEAYADYEKDFAVIMRTILVKSLENDIAIKKLHIEEEMEEIYVAGLKPSFVKKIYKKYYGLE